MENKKLRQDWYNYMIRDSEKDTWPKVLGEQQPE